MGESYNRRVGGGGAGEEASVRPCVVIESHQKQSRPEGKVKEKLRGEGVQDLVRYRASPWYGIHFK